MNEVTSLIGLTLLATPPGTRVKVQSYRVTELVELLTIAMVALGGVVRYEKTADFAETRLYDMWLEKLLTPAQKARVAFEETAKWEEYDACAGTYTPLAQASYAVRNSNARLANKIYVIKAVREVTEWGLKEAKDWVEGEEYNWTHPS